ncbi:NAD dependent epimerase/dehydratase [Niveomyces insectorum RCEF 264]|uniref:NAD dependent epimerase/dehydratase n=1 Tax=Niveomyces insectorum RCEF 264 TaxID=1081102 RepID=A0A167P485_9HYPO|nr:NAD dependent epimerase/dehydratase [Niveomyces insectorum RCEF 264]
MAQISKPVIPKGSTVLVTGVNGFIGSHVADQLIRFGYKVRGTVRDTAKGAWVVKYFDETYGPGAFELVAVPDLTAETAYDKVIKGVAAFVHVASDVSFNADPNAVIPPVIAATLTALKAAFAEPSVRRFVLTSSSSTVVPADPKAYAEGRIVGESTWSEDAKELAWAPPPYTAERALAVYSSSKLEGEQALWKFYEENKSKRPDFVVNTVLPNLNLGKSLDPINQGHPSTSGLITTLFQGNVLPELFQIPQYFVDVQDTALLHVAALIFPDVKSERIFAFTEPFTWDQVLEILRKQNPGRKFPDNFANTPCRIVVKPRARAEELLRTLGRPGWTSLEDSLLLNSDDLRTAS